MKVNAIKPVQSCAADEQKAKLPTIHKIPAAFATRKRSNIHLIVHRSYPVIKMRLWRGRPDNWDPYEIFTRFFSKRLFVVDRSSS